MMQDCFGKDSVKDDKLEKAFSSLDKNSDGKINFTGIFVLITLTFSSF
jgi:Ca2+-binding EF-hand superfamily protein